MRSHIVVAGLGLALCLSCLSAPLAAAPPLSAGPIVPVGAGGNPQVAVFADGAFIVVWNGFRADNAGAIFGRLFDRTGAPRTGAVELLQPAGQILDSVATVPNGFAIVWDQPNAHGVYSVLSRVFNRRGAPLTVPFKVHPDSQYGRCCALIAAGPSSGFTVSWTSFVGIERDFGFTSFLHTRAFDASGQPLAADPVDPPLNTKSPFPLDLDQVFAIALNVDPSAVPSTISIDQADEWQLDLSRGTTGTVLEPATGSFFAQFEVNASFQRSGGFAVAWATGEPCCTLPPLGSSILVRRMSADGTPLGAAPVQANRRTGWEENPRLATLPDGSYFVLWAEVSDQAETNSVLYGRSFDASGAPTSRERMIGSSSAKSQLEPAIASRPAGDAVTVWVEPGPSGAGAIFARLLSVPAH